MKITKRYAVPDILRGISVISMLFYHTLWDLVHIFDVRIPFFRTEAAYIWQQSIRWSFILLSGFCWSFGKKKFKRAMSVLISSVLVSIGSAIAMPNNYILFGVLSLIGSGMLFLIPLSRVFTKMNPFIGCAICILLFFITINIESGSLSLFGVELLRLPRSLYANLFTSYLGLPPSSFSSTDYVPLFPWLFLYFGGYFVYLIFSRCDILKYLSAFNIGFLEWFGKHSLIIYLVHQPIIYGVLYVVFTLIK